jgi:hypothetical protein
MPKLRTRPLPSLIIETKLSCSVGTGNVEEGIFQVFQQNFVGN